MNDVERPTQHPAIETAVFDAEAVLFDERSGMVHHLNPSACAVWMLLDGRAVSKIVDSLAGTVDVPPEELRRDVARVVEDFRAAGLLGG
jgi:PqqD family protein of HPr-rel-A system